jgi:hypothetical protein
MSDHEFENYLTLISRFLRLSAGQREAIGQELRDHFESRLAELLSNGHSHEEAVRLALEEFGDAAGLAADFSKVTQNQRRRLIMRCTAITGGVLTAAILTAMALWPDRHAAPPIGNMVAHAADEQANDKTDEIPETTPAQDLTAETQSKLKKYLAVSFVDAPLKSFLAFLEDELDVQIYAKRKPLEDAGMQDLDAPISIDLSHVRGEMLLDLVLKEIDLGFTIRDGIVMVTTPEDLACILEIRVYDCRNLLGEQQFLQAATPVNCTPASRLINVVCDTVTPHLWSKVGGQGTISEYSGLLVVSQTSAVHGEVATLLEELSRQLTATAKKP